MADDALQANLVILAGEDAVNFLRFCQANPRPCPLLAVGEPGNPSLPTLGQDIDLRHDVPRYRIWRDGELTTECSQIADLWQDDMVSLALGCSFSFDDALAEAAFQFAIRKRVVTCRCSAPTCRRARQVAFPDPWSCQCARCGRGMR